MLGSLVLYAGGQINGDIHTNSVEAVLASLAAGERLIGLDCVALADGFALAKDKSEYKLYGLDKSFAQLIEAEFVGTRIMGRYTPLTFAMLEQIAALVPDAIFVINGQFGDETFHRFLDFLDDLHPALRSALSLELYSPEWLNVAVARGYRRGLLALWRDYESEPFGEAALAFLNQAISSGIELTGVMIRWQNPVTGALARDADEFAFVSRSARIFLHDTSLSFMDQTVLQTQGLHFVSEFTMRALPKGFNADAYRGLHDDLGRLTSLQAAAHFVRHGRFEGRAFYN